jgi:hypothetical protein
MSILDLLMLQSCVRQAWSRIESERERLKGLKGRAKGMVSREKTLSQKAESSKGFLQTPVLGGFGRRHVLAISAQKGSDCVDRLQEWFDAATDKEMPEDVPQEAAEAIETVPQAMPDTAYY